MSNPISQKFDQVQLTVEELLKSFAQSSGFSPETLAPAFGTDINIEELARLDQQFTLGDFSGLPSIEIRSRAELGGARGAYATETNKIYLAQGFLEQATSQQIVKVLLEEISHGIDARINTTDSAGDEGAIFSALVWGEELSEAALAALQQEDDTVELVIDGITVTAEANTLTVTTLTDVVDSTDGVTSLQEALVSAVSGDTITFASEGTITLGGSELDITKSLTILGDIDNDGVGDITIDGNGRSGVLNINDGDNGSSSNVVLDGLTITGGSNSDSGGGIFNRESLSLTDSTVSGNLASDGGGITNHGTLTITDSTVSGNSASYYGGGIDNLNTLTITNSTVSGNSANSAAGIYNYSTLTITNSTVSGNSAHFSGGIYNHGTLTSTYSTISGNSANWGSGIDNHGTLTIANSTVSGNSASYDGGIDNLSTLTITNSTVSGNSASYYGGGIYNRRTLTINNSTISGNEADDGGGIVNYDTLTITNSTVSGNSANYGGGISNSSTSTITNSTISGNEANEGGGIANKLSSTTSLVSTIVADNIAETGTPDIYNDGSSVTVTASNSLIENGTITQDLGNNITGQDPLLDPNGLQDNGGPTQTIALLPGSPAINAGSNPLGLITDQRGEARTLGGGTDIGAYEAELSFGEYGTLNNLNHEWQTVTLNESYTNPVVIVSDPTFNGDDPAVVRLRNVDSNTFQLRLQEPTYLNDGHTEESVSYLVLEAGDWILEDGTRISAGTYNSNNLTSEGFETINLTGFESTPTILTQGQTFNGSDWVTTRIQGQSSNSFQVAMQEQESLNNSGHAEETIGWLAIDQGVANSGDILLEGGTTGRNYDEDEGTVGFSEDFDSTPSVFAKLGSYYGRDTANLRLDNMTSTGFGVRVQEEQSLNSEINHTTESISFLALESDSGFLF